MTEFNLSESLARGLMEAHLGMVVVRDDLLEEQPGRRRPRLADSPEPSE